MANEQISEITTVPTNATVIKIINTLIKRYNSLGSIYTFKGSVQTYDDLLIIQNPNVGDVYNVIEEDAEHQVAAGSNFVWDGTVWDNLGGSLAGLVQSVNGINPDSLGNVLLPLIKNISTNRGTLTITRNNNSTEQFNNIKKLYMLTLGENINLNDLTESGIYICASNAYAANYENCPIQKAFLLEVQATVAGNFIFQFLTQYNDGSTEAGNQYIRTCYNNNWSAWRMAGSGSNLTTYTSLEQIGITPGQETFASIHNALPINSVLEYYRSNSSTFADIYPENSNYGYVRITKLNANITKFEYVKYIALNINSSDISTNDNIGIYYSTYYNSGSPNKLCTWNRAISDKDSVAQSLIASLSLRDYNENNFITEKLRLMSSLMDGADANINKYQDIVFRRDDNFRLGGIRSKMIRVSAGSSTELRSSLALYVNKPEAEGNGAQEGVNVSWSPYYGKVVNTFNGLVRVLDHIQFIGKDNGQFGYIEVTSGADVKAIPQGNYFFYGTAVAGDSDTVLAGSDFQGISMRQSGQAFQILCMGNRMYWRCDDSADAGTTTNPSYSAWYRLATNADNGWTISKGTNGWARENSTGFTIQWGYGRDSRYGNGGHDEHSNVVVTLPRAFTTVYGIWAGNVGSTGKYSCYIWNITKTKFNMGGSNNSDGKALPYWWAVGIS